MNNYKRGGAEGVAVLVRKEIPSQKIEINNTYVKGLDCVTIVINGLKEKIAVIGIYRRPGSRLQRCRIKKIINKVKQISKQRYGREIAIVLAGDFNAHNRS